MFYRFHYFLVDCLIFGQSWTASSGVTLMWHQRDGCFGYVCFLYMQASPPISAGPFVEDIIDHHTSPDHWCFLHSNKQLRCDWPHNRREPSVNLQKCRIQDLQGSSPGGSLHHPSGQNDLPSVDGRIPAPVEVVYPTIYRVLCMPGGAGFVPSTVP